MFIQNNYSDEIHKDLENILSLLNYKILSSEKDRLEFLFKKQLQSLKNALNRKDVPEELYYVFLYRIVGEFLNIKFSGNDLKIENLNLEPMITQITRGDVSTSFKGNSQQEIFSALIYDLINFGKNEIYQYRRIGW